VVLNNYNYGRFLSDAIDSALAQTHRPLEVVVLDDGSTDQSREVIAGYGGRIVPVLQENGGMGAALNNGFAASRGEVVIFLDSDDVLLPTAVERAVALLREPGVVKVHWAQHEVDGRGRPTGGLMPNAPLPEGDLREVVIREGPWGGNGSPTSGNAWLRRFLERVLPMPAAELRRHADSYLNTLACLAGIVRRIDEPQGLYRVHQSNDYASRPKIEKFSRNLHMYRYRCALLADRLRAEGVDVEPAAWMDGNPHYDGLVRMVTALEEIEAHVPPGGTFVLADSAIWSEGRTSDTIVGGRRMMPIPERDDVFWGEPADDAHAIAELERLRAERGATHLVVAWPAFWWFDYYVGFAAHLRERYRPKLANERLVVYELQR
jgi:glycosyltransferase involved in cell wall biosynthesis